MVCAELLPFAQLGESELALWRAWQTQDDALHSPFLSPEYIGAAALVHPRVRVAVLTRDGLIIGFLPFQYPSRLSQALRHAEPAGGDMTDAVGAILAPEVTVSSAELLRACGLRSFLFTHLVAGQQRAGLLAESFDPGLATEVSPSYWSDLRRNRPHVIAEIERRRRRVLDDLGPLIFQMNAASRGVLLERLMELKTAQYRRTKVANVLAAAWKRELLRKLSASVSPDCMGVISTLEAGDRLLALHFGLRRGPILHYWFPVYDPALARYAPGRLLLAAIVEAALKSWDPSHRARGRHGTGQAGFRQYGSHLWTRIAAGRRLSKHPHALSARDPLAEAELVLASQSSIVQCLLTLRATAVCAQPSGTHTFGIVKCPDPPC